ncbi:uncharacterized protein [Periplaneta americana]|uniref:uncharacterized protein isoform X1 n=1 Tax=Periplaneta americana TaxID=6978 RepID=UPI0037E83E81
MSRRSILIILVLMSVFHRGCCQVSKPPEARQIPPDPAASPEVPPMPPAVVPTQGPLPPGGTPEITTKEGRDFNCDGVNVRDPNEVLKPECVVPCKIHADNVTGTKHMILTCGVGEERCFLLDADNVIMHEDQFFCAAHHLHGMTTKLPPKKPVPKPQAGKPTSGRAVVVRPAVFLIHVLASLTVGGCMKI